MIVTDFDECQFNASDCDVNAICENLVGSFHCACFDGFHGNGKFCYKDGKAVPILYCLCYIVSPYTCIQEPRCEDILDCEQLCIRYDGFFECACWHGYTLALDDKNCQGN